MIATTPLQKKTIEIKAGELNLNVLYTTEGLRAIRAMVTFLEAELIGDEKKESGGVEEEKKESITPGKSTPAQSVFSPVLPSPKQRIKFKNWEALAKTEGGTIYKEVVSRILDGYKDGVEPTPKDVSLIIQRMYGSHLKKTSIATYVSHYRRYIRENNLAETPIGSSNIYEPKDTRAKKLPETHPEKDYKKGVESLRVIPIEQVVEIWNLLPDEFTNKQVKAHIPACIQQSGARIDATNYVIREFKENPAFECEETSPGVFLKTEAEK